MIPYFKKILVESSNLFDLNFLIKITKQGLLLPFYHTVSNENLSHIKHLYPITTTKRFNEDLDFFQKNYSAVSYDYLLENHKNKSLRKERTFFLTFDDGLRQFHDEVAPILIRRGIPATFFVNSDFVDNKNMFFRLKVSILIEQMNTKGVTAGQKSHITTLFSKKGLKYEIPMDLHSITDANKEILDEIAPLLDISFAQYLSVHQPYLNTPQIESLIQQGFTVGAHSVSHPYYPLLNEDAQVMQTLKCIQFLNENFGIKERTFSFPYTDFEIKKTFFDRIKNEVDLTFGTANMKLDEIENNFQRIPMEIPDRENAGSIIKSEYLFFLIKMLIGRHMIKRN